MCEVLEHRDRKRRVLPLQSVTRCVLTCSVVSDSLRLHGQKSARLLCPWDSPGKSAAAGGHALLQGILQTQGSNPHLQRLLHWQAGSLSLSISPVSCTAGGLVTTSTAREAPARRGRKISVPPFVSPRGIRHFKGQAARSSGPWRGGIQDMRSQAWRQNRLFTSHPLWRIPALRFHLLLGIGSVPPEDRSDPKLPPWALMRSRGSQGQGQWPLVNSRHYSKRLLCPQSCLIPWDPADRGPPGSSREILGFPRQEYYSGLPCPLPGALSHPGMSLCLLRLRQGQGDAVWLRCLGSHARGLLLYLIFVITKDYHQGVEDQEAELWPHLPGRTLIVFLLEKCSWGPHAYLVGWEQHRLHLVPFVKNPLKALCKEHGSLEAQNHFWLSPSSTALQAGPRVSRLRFHFSGFLPD